MSIAAMQVILLVATALVFWLFMEGYEKRIQFTPSVRKTPFQPFPVKRRHLKNSPAWGTLFFMFNNFSTSFVNRYRFLCETRHMDDRNFS